MGNFVLFDKANTGYNTGQNIFIDGGFSIKK